MDIAVGMLACFAAGMLAGGAVVLFRAKRIFKKWIQDEAR